jgi:hypothetical protein
LLGKGEDLTDWVDLPRGGDSGPDLYTMDDAKRALLPKFRDASDQLDDLPRAACPNDEAVGIFTLTPKYLSKSAYPGTLFEIMGLRPLGSRPVTVTPRKAPEGEEPRPAASAEIFVAGPRRVFREIERLISDWDDRTRGARDLIKMEDFRVLSPQERVHGTFAQGTTYLLEVVLHAGEGEEGQRILARFEAYVRDTLKLTIDLKGRIDVGGLSYVPLRSLGKKVVDVAAFTFVRAIRRMSRLRHPTLSFSANGHRAFPLKLPTGQALDREIRIAVFDGGFPDIPALSKWVTAHRVPGVKAAVKEYQAHGLAVTSALLFGSLERDREPNVPYARIDHYQVLDVEATKSPEDELYPVIKRVASVLEEEIYDFVLLCIGPDTPMINDYVDPWTATMDKVLAHGQTFGVYAVGNRGDADAAAGLNRVQPPGDGVNGFTVGSCSRGFMWRREPYSCVGPGRSPGIVKPDAVAPGGSEEDPYWILSHRGELVAVPSFGTSFAAPEALRAAVAVRAILGKRIGPLALKAILTHCCERHGHDHGEVGWGRVCTDLQELITYGSGLLQVIYQGHLKPKGCLRADIPVPPKPIRGKVTLTATMCIATEVDPQDPVHYTRTGVRISFRPDKLDRSDGRKTGRTVAMFGYKAGMREQELRDDAFTWETTQHASVTVEGEDLKNPVLDIHCNPREGGRDTQSAREVPYAMVISISAPRQRDLFGVVWPKYRHVLEELRPRLEIPPIRT